jgi:formylglycine-generating enzyme required for sulfatase activity
MIGSGTCYPEDLIGKKKEYSLWNRTESVQNYAAREKLELTKSLSLGNVINIEFVLIPPGKYIMGASPDEDDKYEDDEIPKHVVTIPAPFYMSKYEVTQEVYDFIIGRNHSCFKGKLYPVEMITWDDAQEFCKKLGEKTGRNIFLPSESEWEYACRAGSDTPFPPPRDREPSRPMTDEQRRRAIDLIKQLSSNDCRIHEKVTRELMKVGCGIESFLKQILDSQPEMKSRLSLIIESIERYSNTDKIAWTRSNSMLKTHPVGEKEPNGFGLYDMIGNVGEWVEDDWHVNYRGAPIDDRVWIRNRNEIHPLMKCKVIRGGSYMLNKRHCRSSSRYFEDYDVNASSFGLRVVLKD